MDAPWSVSPQTVAAFILFIGVLIFVHELGHFLVAKYFNVRVVKFSLGFGPPILSFTRGETTYQIALIPLGGFVRMAGDNPMEEVDPREAERSITSVSVGRRALIYLAGPAFNLIFPVMCFFAYFLLGPRVISPVVGMLEIGQPAELAGLQTGDRIVEIDGSRVWSFGRIRDLISVRAGEEVEITVDRDGERLTRTVVPRGVAQEDPFGKRVERGIIGVRQSRVGTRIGVAVTAKNTFGFESGDRVLSVDGEEVVHGEALDRAVRKAAGKRVEFVVARTAPLSAGDVLYALHEAPQTLQVEVPGGATNIAALGLAQSDAFVRAVVPGSAAERGGLRAGDQVLEVAGRRIRLFYSFLSEMAAAELEPVDVVVNRGGQQIALRLQNDKVECKHEVTGKGRVAFDPGVGTGPFTSGGPCMALLKRVQGFSHWTSSAPYEFEEAKLSLLEALSSSVRQTGMVIGMVSVGIAKMFSGEISTDNVGGPLQLFRIAAQAVEIGIAEYLRTMAFISVNLGLINLLPIPIFDGGHLMFCAIEAVKRRPLSLRTKETALRVGLLIILALFVLAFRNDIKSLGIF